MKLEDIPKDVKFTGYYWLDNTHKPVVIVDECINLSEYRSASPFIVEAYFTDNKISYSIKHFDGLGHIVTGIKITDIKKKTEHKYIADPAIIREGKVKGLNIKKLSFLQEWKGVPDELCENMDVLKPQRIVFTGFEKENSND